MITRITKANADKYRALFAQAVEALRTHDENGNLSTEPGAGTPVIASSVSFEEVNIDASEYAGGEYYIKDGDNWVLTTLDSAFNPDAQYAIRVEAGDSITTLEEYFSYIAYLNAIDKKFTILPLDEEYFSIDANTRKIEIPTAFRTSGIAVQGDEVAEILYFKIDRFFDMDDLANKDIFIQWRAPADEEGNRAEGVSVPWFSGTDIEPGYVVFGWPLSSELTAHAGQMEFAVRFYTHDETLNKIIYSLSTLTATAEIKPSLNYDLKEILADESSIVDANNLITNRIVNSEPDDVNAPDPVEPEIIDNIFSLIGLETPDFTFLEETINEEGKKIYNIYMTNPKTGDEYDCLYKIQAISSDAGVISYNWIKRDSEGEYINEGPVSSGLTFIPTDDTAINLNKIYYRKRADDIYVPYVFSDTETSMNPSVDFVGDNTLYERFSQAIINHSEESHPTEHVLSTYQIRVSNRVGRKTARTFSGIAVVEGPEAPTITSDITENNLGVLSKDALSLDLAVTANTDDHSYVQYVWQRGHKDENSENIVNIENIETTTDPNYTIIGSAYPEDNTEDVENGDGFYRVVVESKLNSTIEEATGGFLRVTHPAMAPEITRSVPTVPATDSYNINGDISVTIKLNPIEEKNRTNEDSIAYQWYRYVSAPGGDTLFEDLQNASEGLYVVTENDIKIEGANENRLPDINTGENESGHYFCQVTNTYNGDKVVKCSPFFNVIDNRYVEV